MLGFFKKKKPVEVTAAEISSGIVAVQLALGGATLPQISNAGDRAGLGYIFGAHDAARHLMEIPANSKAGLEALSLGFRMLGDTDRNSILKQCLDIQTDGEFRKAMERGGTEALAFFRDNDKKPMGLAKHLLGQSYAT